MQRAPILNSPFGFHRFNDRDFDRDDRLRRFHHHNFNDIMFSITSAFGSFRCFRRSNYHLPTAPYPYGDYYHPYRYGA